MRISRKIFKKLKHILIISVTHKLLTAPPVIIVAKQTGRHAPAINRQLWY